MKSISKDEIQRRLLSENPWWGEAESISDAYSSYDPRAYLELFFPLVTETTKHRAVVLLGARRVGKTVLIHHAIRKLIHSDVPAKRILYCSIDSPIYNGLSLDDILREYASITTADIAREEVFVFFDEIQYLKDWEQHLKSLVDLRTALRFCVSGSAAAALRLKSNESGAGRFTEFLLPPLTFYEYLGLLGKNNLVTSEES